MSASPATTTNIPIAGRATVVPGVALAAALGVTFLLPIAEAAGFESPAGGDGLFDVRTADVAAPGSLSITVSGVSYVLAADQDPSRTRSRAIQDGKLGVGLGLAPGFEAFARIGAALYEHEGARPFSSRDGVVGAKLAIPRGPDRLRGAVLGELSIPLGKRERGFSTGSFDPALSLALTWAVEDGPRSYARLHANAGWRIHGDSRGRGFEGVPPFHLEPVHPARRRGRLDLRLAFEIGTSRTILFLEGILDRLENAQVSWSESPIFFTPGLRHRVGERWSFLLAAKVALATDDEATTAFRPPEEIYPDWQLGFALTWTRSVPASERPGGRAR